MKELRYFFTVIIIFVSCSVFASNAKDPLPSWNNSTSKQRIIKFVESVTNIKSQSYVPKAERIATFDNDGTLWVEKPMYPQILFSLDRMRELADLHPDWQTNQPYKDILTGEYKNILSNNAEIMFQESVKDMSPEGYKSIAYNWITENKNPRFNKAHIELIYQPMLEVMDYLRANGFSVYIVSGGIQDFIRAYALQAYKVPDEKVVGAVFDTNYKVTKDNEPYLVYENKFLIRCNYEGKPEAIHMFIGKKPIIAFGNSNGDKAMLDWTQSNDQKALMLFVHHDDAKREFAYDVNSKVGTFPKSLFDHAEKNNWQIISMKDDWKVVFPFELKKMNKKLLEAQHE